ncbi:putative lipoprotein LpqT [Mycolicibacterium parafortuitum]|uniref:Putative lipoprotein LpqT n=1 Tax=Mycolicibacterium parafortuitum TaxID=39692 RepID=A0A7I7U2V3_MYCPF|nr:LpqN/LpqT family lipoprotein [Mycolicibacterium parafortuitum]BBY75690.1 putative lipoprotein LpqT [Mycolicibacterium parafortuitum]
MTARLRLAVALTATLTLSGCAPEAPDYQSVWSTTSSAPPTSTTTAAADGDEPPINIATFLERAGVVGEPVAADKLTDLIVTIPTPPGWQPYRNTNLAPGTRMIAKGDTYPTAMLMVFELIGDFDVAQALSYANTDAKTSENFTELNSSTEDFAGFPSSMIEGSYDLAGSRMHSYNRIVFATGAPPDKQRYLIQFTVTGYADKAVEEASDIEAIIRGFTVKLP